MMSNRNHININRVGVFLSGMIFPISGFVYALLHPNSKYFKLLFVMFFSFIGCAICMDSIGNSDIGRYLIDFEEACRMKGVGFREYFTSRPEANQIDYYSSFMFWFVSRFTSDNRVFLGVLAMVMALFFAANVNYVIKHVELSKINIFFVVVLALIPQAVFITHRWWTALQVFFFGLLPVVVEKKYIRLFWCFFSAVVIHFSFVFPLFLLILSILLPKKNLYPYIVLYLATLLLVSFDFGAFSSFIENMPELIAIRTEEYVNYEIQEHNFLSQSAKLVMKIANATIAVWILLKYRKQLRDNDFLRQFYIIMLWLGSFANIAALTEWGWRYFELTNMCFVVFYMFFVSDEVNYNNSVRFFWRLSPLFVYFIVYQIRGYLDVIGPFQLIAGNYFTMWFIEDAKTVLELIKSIL